MKISEKFEEEICSKYDDRTFCKRDMLQLHACATVEIWNILFKNQYEVGMYKSILDVNEKVLDDMIKKVI